MKNNLFLLCLLLCSIFSLAQSPKKPVKPQEKPPTQKEMDEMMKEMENMYKNMTPEEKRMYDSMNIKMPNLKNTARFTDKQYADAWDEENRVVPKKDVTRIAWANQQTVSSASLMSYLQKTHNELLKLYTEKEKAESEEAYSRILKKNASNSTAMANAGVELWMYGKYKAAIYFTAKVLNNFPVDDNTLNNYAAFLTMAGAEEKALPLLNYLNNRYPKNSSLLNNLSQAWFGLGEMVKAEKYADSTIRLCAWHPQANTIKSRIEESKGHTPEAITHEKNGIKKLYSDEKEQRLKKLGYTLKGPDMIFHMKPEADPMGMGKFQIPSFPLTAADEVGFKKDWIEFRQGIETYSAKILPQVKIAEQNYARHSQQLINRAKYIANASMAANKPVGSFNPLPPFAKKGILKLKEMEKDGGIQFRIAKVLKEIAAYQQKAVELKKEYDAAIAKLKEEDLEQTGEGLPNKDFCPKYEQVVSKYLKASNEEYEKLWNDYLLQLRLKMSEELFWYQFIQWPQQFELTKLTYQLNWLNALKQVKYYETYFFDSRPLCIKSDEKKKGKSKLSSYNDMNCKYKSTLNLFFGTIEQNCNKITAKMEIDIQGIKLFETEIKTDDENVRDANDLADFMSQSFVSCTIAAGPSFEKGIGTGPFKLEAEVGVKGILEFGKEGITDVGVKVEAEIKATANELEILPGGAVKDLEPKVELTLIGTESKFTVNSGFSVEGKGILKTAKTTIDVIKQVTQ